MHWFSDDTIGTLFPRVRWAQYGRLAENVGHRRIQF
jgi:hypothetical protein